MTRMKPNGTQTRREDSPHPVHIPRFVTDEDAGLGDVITRLTHTFGIKACGACQRRAAALNRWLPFRKEPRNHSTSRS